MSKNAGFTPMFSDDEIDQWFDIFKEEAEDQIFNLLAAAGEMFVKYAREQHTYEDRTGNLRSSIGYLVYKDGKEVLSSSFAKVQGYGENNAIVNFKTKDGRIVKFHAKGQSGDGSQGAEQGRQLAKTIAISYPSGYVLVGVAGMQYAAAVEAKGYDVVTGACLQSEAWLRKSIQSVFKQYNNG